MEVGWERVEVGDRELTLELKSRSRQWVGENHDERFPRGRHKDLVTVGETRTGRCLQAL